VTLPIRHPISFALIVVALLATVAVFTVARPTYRPAVEIENVDLAKERHYTVSDVRAAFAGEGIRFTAVRRAPDSSMTWLGFGPWAWSDEDLYVQVLPEKGVVGLGHGEWEERIYEERVGNVIVHYGGSDEALLAKVERAVATLDR
jgi:hypothetical protein